MIDHGHLTAQGGTGTLPATGDAPTQPIPLISGIGVLAAQLARFGELAGRDLSGRAALRADRACVPLTPAEHQEMAALHAAITGVTAGERSEPVSPPRPLRLRRRPSPGPDRSAGRHHRPAGPSRADGAIDTLLGQGGIRASFASGGSGGRVGRLVAVRAGKAVQQLSGFGFELAYEGKIALGVAV
jgi:hypothetical protein